jgi:hypothetical protein
MKIELQEKPDHRGVTYYWIYVNGSPEIPIYRDEDEARIAYNQIVEFHKNPPEPKVLESINIS